VLQRSTPKQSHWLGASLGGIDNRVCDPPLEEKSFDLEHPGTKVLIVNGLYDLVTPYLASRWLVNQLAVPDAVRAGIRLRLYEGGHMMYMRPESRRFLARDAADLYGPPGAAPPSQ
jgi:hypothetical protein